MTCKEVQRQLTESTSPACAEVREHLKDCESCRELHEDLESLKALSTELKQTAKEVPPFFASRVCSRVSSERPHLLYVRLAALLGALVVVSVGITLLPGLYQVAGDRLTARVPVQPAKSEAATEEPTSEVLRIDRNESQIPSSDAVPSPILIGENPSSGYQLKIPATIQVRQTQAENEFYLRNVSH